MDNKIIMEINYFFIGLGFCLIELFVISTLLNKKKPMHVATLIVITFGIVGLIRTCQDRNLIFKHSEKNISQVEQNKLASIMAGLFFMGKFIR